LLEALVAIVVLTIILGSIATPILITTASRVQNRKAEQAQQIAQFFTEETRLLMSQIDTWTYSGTTPSLSNANPTLSYSPIGSIPPLPTASYSSVSNVPAPTANCGITGPSYSVTCTANQLFGYDLDKDGAADFYVQMFRTADTLSAVSDEVIGFQMGVRVYSVDAINRLGFLTYSQQQLGFTSGRGKPEQPIAVAYTSVYRGEEEDALVAFNTCTVGTYTGGTSTYATTQILNDNLSYSILTHTANVTTQNPAPGERVLCGSPVIIGP
jgi:type II secretory pathway pseudopilin PulG